MPSERTGSFLSQPNAFRISNTDTKSTKKGRMHMGKGNRQREAKEKYIAQFEKEQKEKMERKRKNKKRLIAVLIAGVLLLVIVLSSVFLTNHLKDSGYFLRNKISLSSEHYEIDNAMMSYYFNSLYLSFVDYYGDSLAQYGLDQTKSLKKQNYGNNMTWFDYFASAAKSSVEELLVLAEGAYSEGITLTDDEKQLIQRTAERSDTSEFGRGVQTDDLQKCLELSALAVKYEEILRERNAASEDEINAYYEKNALTYQTCGYRSYSFGYVADGGVGLTEEEAKSYAEQLRSACEGDGGEQAFIEYITAYMNNNGTTDVEKAVQGTLTANAAYKEDTDYLEWAFEAEVGDTYLKHDESGKKFTVYLLVSLPERDSSPTKNVRHILCSNATYGSPESARKAAENMYEEWQSGDQSETSFANLAKEFSDDGGSRSAGGRYSHVYQGQMVETFENWCFDESRKPGDTGLVETTYGVHIMYFISNGPEKWYADISDLLTNNNYNEAYNELKGQHSVEIYDDILQKIPA